MTSSEINLSRIFLCSDKCLNCSCKSYLIIKQKTLLLGWGLLRIFKAKQMISHFTPIKFNNLFYSFLHEGIGVFV